MKHNWKTTSHIKLQPAANEAEKHHLLIKKTLLAYDIGLQNPSTYKKIAILGNFSEKKKFSDENFVGEICEFMFYEGLKLFSTVQYVVLA